MAIKSINPIRSHVNRRFFVVNLFTQMVTTRNHGVGQVPGVVEMNPTDLPELFRPSRGPGKPQKTTCLETNVFRESRQK